MINKNTLLLFLVLLYFSCEKSTPTTEEKKQAPKTEKAISSVPQSEGTKYMINELKRLISNGKPEYYYHWNAIIAEVLQAKLKTAKGIAYQKIWLQYVKELLNAGDSQACINEIETTLKAKQMTPEMLLERGDKATVEVLALAYLRLGEQVNCQNNHTEFSCILPLQAAAVHQLKDGSTKAAALYTLLHNHAPNEQYQWLLNLAYMTLGQHPDQVPEALRVDFPNWEKEQRDFPAFPEIASKVGVAMNGLSGGVCLDDFNNDGFVDIFATSYGMEDQVRFYLNDGKGGFVDYTDQAGLIGIVSGLNCIHADYDNDGLKDILILRGAWFGRGGRHPNSLLKNEGNGKFSDVTKAAGILSFRPTQTAAWADVNRDGWLDLFIGNESKKGAIQRCEFFLNQKDGTFKEASKAFGLANIQAYVKGVSFGDINNDQWPDLFISVMGGKNLLYKNEKGTFVEIGEKAGIQEPIFSFPCWFWDVNNDGYQDIFVSGYDTPNFDYLAGDFLKELQGKPVTTAKPRLYINNGKGRFMDRTAAFGLDKTMYAMGSNFGDLDNDGFLDCYIGTGAPDYTSVVPNRMFRNQGGKGFEEVTSAGRFGHIQKGHGVGFADIDQDGDQDIYAVLGGAFEGDLFTNVLFENPISKNQWIIIALKGTRTNKSGIGSVLELQLDNGQKIFHTVGTGSSFGSNSLQAEIGLGTAQVIQKMIVRWQSGVEQVFKQVPVNKKYELEEGATKLKDIPYAYQAFAKDGKHEHAHH